MILLLKLWFLRKNSEGTYLMNVSESILLHALAMIALILGAIFVFDPYRLSAEKRHNEKVTLRFEKPQAVTQEC